MYVKEQPAHLANMISQLVLKLTKLQSALVHRVCSFDLKHGTGTCVLTNFLT